MDIDKQLMEHSFELKELKNIIGNVALAQKESNAQIKILTEGFTKLDLFLEKQSNMENRHSDSVNRLHKRIDDVDNEIKQFHNLASEYLLTKKDVADMVAAKNKLILGVLGAVGMGLWQLLVK